MNYSALSALTLACEQELHALRHHFIVGGQIQVYNQHLALKPLIYIFFSGSRALISTVSCLGTKNEVLGEVHFLWTMSKALMEQGRQENCLAHHLFISNEWDRENAARQSR